MSLARKQLSIIHVAKAKLGLADEDYRAILRQEGGVDSSCQLDRAGFDAVMRRFESLGFTSPHVPPRPDFGIRPGMATPRQVELMRTLWSEYKGSPQDDSSLGRWLDRTYGVSALRFIEYEQAQKAIGALIKMKRRKTARAKEGADA